MDTFDEIGPENYTISPVTTAEIVRAIDERLPSHMRFTVTTADDRIVQRDAFLRGDRG